MKIESQFKIAKRMLIGNISFFQNLERFLRNSENTYYLLKLKRSFMCCICGRIYKRNHELNKKQNEICCNCDTMVRSNKVFEFLNRNTGIVLNEIKFYKQSYDFNTLLFIKELNSVNLAIRKQFHIYKLPKYKKEMI